MWSRIRVIITIMLASQVLQIQIMLYTIGRIVLRKQPLEQCDDIRADAVGLLLGET